MKHPGFWVMIRTESNIITPIFPHPSIWDCRGAFFWSQCSILFRWYQMVSQAQHHQTLQNAWASVWTSQSRRFAEDLRAALPKTYLEIKSNSRCSDNKWSLISFISYYRKPDHFLRMNDIDNAMMHACHGLLSTTNHNASLSRLQVCRYNFNPGAHT